MKPLKIVESGFCDVIIGELPVQNNKILEQVPCPVLIVSEM